MKSICEIFFRALLMASEIVLVVLFVIIHCCTILMLPNSVSTLVFTIFLPMIAEAYWISQLRPPAGALFHPLTVWCAVWVILLAIKIFAQNMFANWRAQQST